MSKALNKAEHILMDAKNLLPSGFDIGLKALLTPLLQHARVGVCQHNGAVMTGRKSNFGLLVLQWSTLCQKNFCLRGAAQDQDQNGEKDIMTSGNLEISSKYSP